MTITSLPPLPRSIVVLPLNLTSLLKVMVSLPLPRSTVPFLIVVVPPKLMESAAFLEALKSTVSFLATVSLTVTVTAVPFVVLPVMVLFVSCYPEMSVVPDDALISRPFTGFESTTSLLPSAPVVTATSLDETPEGSTTSTESVPRVAMEEAQNAVRRDYSTSFTVYG